ncbi:MAG: hypothetical protein V4549_09215, partial [Bacteroidota bacterium]
DSSVPKTDVLPITPSDNLQSKIMIGAAKLINIFLRAIEILCFFKDYQSIIFLNSHPDSYRH